ncbi:MAG TPA: peptidase S24, partial [Chryseobacterium sp.]|nr:peptidase S24 [Chryseobacterium sp.]
VKLVSQNPYHQPKDFKIKDITAIALVKASVRFNTMF